MKKKILFFMLLFFSIFIYAKTPTIGILTAVIGESTPILNAMHDVKSFKYRGGIYYKGKLGKWKVVLNVSGIGIVNAAVAATRLIDHFNPDYILFSGSAGGINPKLHIGDVVLSKSIYLLDLGDPDSNQPLVPAFENNPIRKLPVPVYFYGNKNLMNIILQNKQNILLRTGHDKNCQPVKSKIIAGKISTSDHFPDNLHAFKRMKMNHVDVTAMEGGSLMQVCWLTQKPCVVIRSISNLIGQGKASCIAWNKKNISLANHNAGMTTVYLIKHLNSHSTLTKRNHPAKPFYKQRYPAKPFHKPRHPGLDPGSRLSSRT